MSAQRCECWACRPDLMEAEYARLGIQPPQPPKPRPAPDVSWVTTEPTEPSGGWPWVLGACALLVLLFGVAAFAIWAVTR